MDRIVSFPQVLNLRPEPIQYGTLVIGHCCVKNLSEADPGAFRGNLSARVCFESDPRRSTLDAIQAELEVRGIRFVETADELGVMLRKGQSA
jgi:hypothetical protein